MRRLLKMIASMRSMILTILFGALLFISCRTRAPGEQPVNGIVSTVNRSTQPCININTATAKELMQLTGVGEVMSEKIISHRTIHGKFRRPQDLIIIEGFGEKKYRAIAPLICVE